jgi:small subunit ribosomal protein S5
MPNVTLDRRGVPAEEKQFEEQVIHIDRVARVVKGGRRFRFRALVAVGDHKKRVGIGTAKGADVTGAITKAVEVAKKNLMTIPLYKDTIPHEVEAKVGGAHILIKPASAGTGLIAGGAVRTILEVGGIRNVLSKSLGSSNKTNIAYATIAALQQLVPAKNWVMQPKSKTPVPTSKSSPKEAKDKADKPEAKAKEKKS